jgi:hypothetical protein
LLARLGAHLREEQRNDAALERVARSEASAEELATLRELDELALAAARPLPEAAIDRIAASVTQARRPARLFSTSWRRRAAVLVAPLALAAAAVVYVAAPRRGDDALPDYDVLTTSPATTRGPSPDAASRLRLPGVLGGDLQFLVLLRPRTAAGRPLVAHVFTVDSKGASAPLDVAVDVSADGAVRLQGSARGLASARELRVIVESTTSSGSRAFVVPIDRAE